MTATGLPTRIENEEELDELLSRPGDDVVEAVRRIASPLMILGGSGKMGPTLALLARRAADVAAHPLEVVVAARFSDDSLVSWFSERGISTLRCDLLVREEIARLPDATSVIFMAGRKFGTSDRPDLTWSMNTIAPALCIERYAGSRIVLLSTGCVYPFVETSGPGSAEGDELTPLGEYANACVARERIVEYLARRNHTPMALMRLNYAIDMRYGVLVDIAKRVRDGEPIDLTMGHLNCIWQGDANAMAIRLLDHVAIPPFVANVTGPGHLSVRTLAAELGRRLGREPLFIGQEASTALLSDASRMMATLGPPTVPLDAMLDWTADWVVRGGRDLGRPTHYEASDGRY